MSISAYNSTEIRRKKASQNASIKSVKSNYESTNITQKSNIVSSDDDSFIYSKARSSNSKISRNKDSIITKKTSSHQNNLNSKSLKNSKPSVRATEKRNNENSNQCYSDSDSDIPIQYNRNKVSNQSNRLHPINKSITRTNASRNRGIKSSITLDLSSSESSSDSLRVKKDVETYRTINYKLSDSESDIRVRKYQNTLDTVLESDNSDDIPFLDSVQEDSICETKSNKEPYLIDEPTENFESNIEKVSQIESPKNQRPQKNSIDSEKQNPENEIPHQKEKSNKEENIIFSSTSSDNLNTEKKHISRPIKINRNKGVVRTKHIHVAEKYKTSKRKRKPSPEIQISDSDSEEEQKQEIESKDDSKNEKEHQNQNESSHSNSQNETENENNSDELILDTENDNIKIEEFEKGVRNEKEIKRLSNLYMKRLPGYKIPNDLIPYKMHTDTKISFKGKKAKFILFRGELPLLMAKLKNKSGSDPIVNIYKYEKPASNSKKEKKKEKSKKKKVQPIAIIITGSNFSTFSLLKSEPKSEVDPNNDTEKDDFSSIHNKYGPGFGKGLMTVKYSMPKVDYAPRIVNVSFSDPPNPVPSELLNRKPKFTYGSTFILDIGGRVAKRSIKNCIMVDENNKDWMSIMKIHDSEVSIEVYPLISELCVFAFGISSVLCKL